MARNSTLPPYVPRVAIRFFTAQLARPAGIAGLLSSILGEDQAASDAPLEKLEAIATVLTTVPATVRPQVSEVDASLEKHL